MKMLYFFIFLLTGIACGLLAIIALAGRETAEFLVWACGWIGSALAATHHLLDKK
jgi:hypothetical protein